ncbi:MAG: phosphoenolpyruvate synthase [Dehalococcoidia bacterium]
MEKQVVGFSDVGKGDLLLVGGKGANLGEMVRSGIPVPPGFIVTTESFFRFMEESSLKEKINSVLSNLDPNDSDRLYEVASQVKKWISEAKMPEDISQKIANAYERQAGLVAVRSSATAEDLGTASFAGQQRTFLNVEGTQQVIQAVQECWASLFEPRAIFYRAEQNIDHLSVGIAVPVQRMVQSNTSGVMFTIDPVTGTKRIMIEAVYGLGESIVSGNVTPDMYLVDRIDFTILHKETATQEWQLVKDTNQGHFEDANIEMAVPKEKQSEQKISDDIIVALAKIGRRIEKHYKAPQDIEWAMENGKLYVVQTRPITTTDSVKAKTDTEEVINSPLLLSGSPASPGIGSGHVKIISDVSETGKLNKGEVLVAEMTNPDYVPAMKRASAIVTERGGRTCHAAIVSRELGVPCVVGAEKATTALKDGQGITVDGSSGNVYEGIRKPKKKGASTTSRGSKVKTKTKLYVNCAEPELAEDVAARNVDGIGLLRAEFMIAQIGMHPSFLLREGREEEFIDQLAEGLMLFAKAFNPRPVVYRTTDFKTNEYRNLMGGKEFEDIEENPMIGYRGCSRYVSRIESFKLELAAIRKVRREYKNLWVMLPFVRTVSELISTKNILGEAGMISSDDFKIWMMAEIPSNVFLIDQFVDAGIDGVSIGSNDLTQLVLGVDRDNSRIADIFDELDDAVLMAVERIVRATTARGLTCSICGQAPSFYPELTERLVRWGITSISVNADMIEQTREIIADVENSIK